MHWDRSVLMAFQGTFWGGRLVLPMEVLSTHVSSMSQATRRSDSLNSYFLDQPRGAYLHVVKQKVSDPRYRGESRSRYVSDKAW